MPTRALLLHSEPAALLPFLREHTDDAQWHAAANAAQVLDAVREFAPEVVFSIKHSGFPGEGHLPALRAASVRWFHVGGAGRDHLGSWDAERVRVTDCAGVLAPFFAERALAAMWMLATGLHQFAQDQAARRWEPRSFRAVGGRTLLIVGVGHTGGELAWRARALGMRVLGVRASGAAHPWVDEMHGPGALHELLPRTDVVSLHLRLTDATRHSFGAAEFARLPAGAILLNASRGAIVDTKALRAALDDKLAAAWLDVFEQEPLPADDPLWSHPRVLITPHCADQVEDWPMRFARRFVELWRGEFVDRRGPPTTG